MNFFRFKWLPILIAVLPVFFPLYLFKGLLFGVPINLLELIVFIVFIVFIFAEKLWSKSFWLVHAVQWKLWPVLLFVVAGVLSTIFVQQDLSFIDGTPFDSLTKAIGILKGWILAPLLYFFMARHTFAEKPSLIVLSLDALLLGGASLAVLALSQELTGSFITADQRASGPFESANYLSLYLGPIFIYGILQSLKKEAFDFQKNSRILLTILIGLALFFTESYASFIAIFVTLVLWLILTFKNSSFKFKGGFLIFFIVLFGLLVLSQIGSEKFQVFFEFAERSSSSVRLQVYEISLNLLKENPVFGVGLGSYELFYQNNAERILGIAPFEWVMLHPHNLFLALWLNMGILGLISFIWLCVKALTWFRESSNKGHKIAIYMLLTILVHGIFDTPYFKNDLAFEFWLLMAILL